MSNFLAGFNAIMNSALTTQKIRGQNISNEAALLQVRQAKSQEVMQMGAKLGYVDDLNNFDRDKWQSHIDGDDEALRKQASMFGAALADRVQGNKNFLPTDIEKLSDGSFITTGKNLETGERGVITENASTDPNDKVVKFGADEAGNLMSLIFNTTISPEGSDPLVQQQLNKLMNVDAGAQTPKLVRDAYGMYSRLPEDQRADVAKQVDALLSGQDPTTVSLGDPPAGNVTGTGTGTDTGTGTGTGTGTDTDTGTGTGTATGTGTGTATGTESDVTASRNDTIARIDNLKSQLVDESTQTTGPRGTRGNLQAVNKNKATNAQLNAAYEKLPEVIEIREQIEKVPTGRGGNARRNALNAEIEKIKNNPLVPTEVNEIAANLPDDRKNITETLQGGNPAGMNQQTITTLANYMREQNITNINDVNKLPKNARKAVMAAMVANVPNSKLRLETLDALTNIIDTGSSTISLKDVAAMQVNAGNLEVRIAELTRQRGNDADAADTAMSEITDTILQPLIGDDQKILDFDDLEDGEVSKILTNLAEVRRNAALAQNNRRIGRPVTSKQLAAENQFLDALIPVAISQARAKGLSAIFNPLESLYSIPRGDPRYVPGSMAAQVGLEQDRNGKPTRIFFRVADPQGGRSEDSISISDLSKVMDQSSVNLLIGIARKNQEPRTVPRSQ